jgi:hypothetical protein
MQRTIGMGRHTNVIQEALGLEPWRVVTVMDIPRCKGQNVPSKFPEPFINGIVSSQAISYLAGYSMDKYGDLLIHELKVRNGKRSISA